jgi:hypothetical protein
MPEQVGYARLVERHSLPARKLRTISAISSAVQGRRSRDLGEQIVQEFQPTYLPADSLFGDLQPFGRAGVAE